MITHGPYTVQCTLNCTLYRYTVHHWICRIVNTQISPETCFFENQVKNRNLKGTGSLCYTLYTVHCTLHTVHCTLYTVHCTLCTVHCSLYTVQCSTLTWITEAVSCLPIFPLRSSRRATKP